MHPSPLRRLLPTTLLTLAGLLAASAASAQEVELYSKPAFNGMRLRLNTDAADVAAYGMGNSIASVVVKTGQWEFCTAAQFRGACITVGPGRYTEMPPALRGTLASIRRADVGAAALGAGVGGNHPRAVAAAPMPAPLPAQPAAQGQLPPPLQSQQHAQQQAQAQTYQAPLQTAAGAPVPMPTESVILYEHANFDGSVLPLSTSAPRLGEINYNDLASSVIVQRGRWQFCEHHDYGGECMVLGVGRHVLGGHWNDRTSSIRPVFGQDDRPLPVTGGLVLHENTDYSGRESLHVEAMANLKAVGMNDRASSVEVLDGQWQLCTDADFGGRCVIVKPGRYQMGTALDNKLSSLRPVVNGVVATPTR